MVYYKLQTLDINPGKLFSDIVRLVGSVPNEEKDSLLLVVKLQKVSDYAKDSPLPKITYQGDSLT
jgi:hypothetical protein